MMWDTYIVIIIVFIVFTRVGDINTISLFDAENTFLSQGIEQIYTKS